MVFINSFFNFFKNPSPKEKISSKSLLITYFFLFILIKFILFKSVFSFINYYDIELIPKYKFNNHYTIDFILKALLFAPILEEFLFRSILIPKNKYLLIFVFSISFFIMRKMHVDLVINIMTSSFLCVLLYLSKLNINPIFYNKYYKAIVYISSISFGLGHILNYELTPAILLLSPIIILPKIFSGFSLAFIRVKFGLIYVILFHSLHNALPFIIKYFS